MRIYLYDCADSNSLIIALANSGHEVTSPRSEGLLGADDSVHFAHAVLIRCAIFTKNPADFIALHEEYVESGRIHFGILLVYQERIHRKDLPPDAIARSLRNLESSGIPIANAVHNLNHWR